MSRPDPAPPVSASPAFAAISESSEILLRREVNRRIEAEQVVRKQIAALAKIRSLLVREHELPDFVEALLETITRECDALWCTLWSRQTELAAMKRRRISWSDTSTREQVETFATRHRVAMQNLSQFYEEVLLQHQRTLIIDPQEPRVPAVIRRFYRKRRVGAAIISPLLFDRRLLGWVSCLTRDDQRRPSRDKVAFIEAMAQQATIAMHLASRSEAERAQREAEASERLACEREKDTAEINSLLQLATGPASPRHSEEIVRSAFTNTVKLLRGTDGVLWTWDAESPAPEPVWKRYRGRTSRIGSKVATESPASRKRAAAKLLGWAESPAPRAVKTSPAQVRAIFAHTPSSSTFRVVPLQAAEESLGAILVASPEAEEPSVRRMVAVRALAMQAALALRLEALSDSERCASIAGERTRIARDLHDLLAQSFSGISLQVEALRAEQQDLPARITRRLDRIREQATRSMNDLRRTLLVLRPALLDDRPLAAALRELIKVSTPRPGRSVHFDDRSDGIEIDSKVELHLFAIASEALQNALTHSAPGEIRLTLASNAAAHQLVVENRGKFQNPKHRNSHGLTNMRERTAAIGGKFSLRHSRGRVRVEVVVPR